MLVEDLERVLDELAPRALTESWDTTGLLVGRRGTEVSKVIVALDLTEDVVVEAVTGGYRAIVTHHPLLFAPLRRVTDADRRGTLVSQLIAADVAYFAVHTNLDGAVGGLCDLVDARTRSPRPTPVGARRFRAEEVRGLRAPRGGRQREPGRVRRRGGAHRRVSGLCVRGLGGGHFRCRRRCFTACRPPRPAGTRRRGALGDGRAGGAPRRSSTPIWKLIPTRSPPSTSTRSRTCLRGAGQEGRLHARGDLAVVARRDRRRSVRAARR